MSWNQDVIAVVSVKGATVLADDLPGLIGYRDSTGYLNAAEALRVPDSLKQESGMSVAMHHDLSAKVWAVEAFLGQLFVLMGQAYPKSTYKRLIDSLEVAIKRVQFYRGDMETVYMREHKPERDSGDHGGW